MIYRQTFIRIIAAVLFLFGIQQVGSANEKDSTAQNIFTLIYNQHFSEAEKALALHCSQLEPFYYNILNLDLYWWKYSLSRSKDDAKSLNSMLSNFNKNSANKQEVSINELIRLSYQMRYEIKRYNLVGALFLRSEARSKIETVKQYELSFLGDRQNLFDLYVSLFDYFDTAINPFLFGRKSEAYSKSLLKLEKYSFNNDLILSTLAHYFLGRIYMKVEKQPEKGMGHFKILAKRFPENPLFYELANGLNPRF